VCVFLKLFKKEYGSPEGCNHENYGLQTLSENIADINGLRLAYEALFHDTSPTAGLADKREFHMAGAQMWCSSFTPEAMCDRSRDDVHAIAPFRVRLTYSHVPYFAEDYGCPIGSPMHRHLHERIVLFGPEAEELVAARNKKK
jgi:predicted metalloendopeptidase